MRHPLARRHVRFARQPRCWFLFLLWLATFESIPKPPRRRAIFWFISKCFDTRHAYSAEILEETEGAFRVRWEDLGMRVERGDEWLSKKVNYEIIGEKKS